jgi:hypothetical protein
MHVIFLDGLGCTGDTSKRAGDMMDLTCSASFIGYRAPKLVWRDELGNDISGGMYSTNMTLGKVR